jgi:hypothetical protein
MIGVPERTWRRWQAKARAGRAVRGPWPRPARCAARDRVLAHALAHPAWGHRKIWAMVRHDGHVVSEATVLRVLRDESLILPAVYQRERRKLAARRKAAFAAEPSGPNQVWQLDFSEFETTTGGAWRIAGCRDYWSKYEHRWHISPTANQLCRVYWFWAVAAVVSGRVGGWFRAVSALGIRPLLLDNSTVFVRDRRTGFSFYRQRRCGCLLMGMGTAID